MHSCTFWIILGELFSGFALRVLPSVTRLTVYRWLQVRAWGRTGGLGPKLCVARRAFKHDELRIDLSEFDKGLEEQRLGIKERSCVNGMSVIITSAEISRRTSFLR